MFTPSAKHSIWHDTATPNITEYVDFQKKKKEMKTISIQKLLPVISSPLNDSLSSACLTCCNHDGSQEPIFL